MRTALALATCFGVGYAPFAPGTVGSLVGLLLWTMLPESIEAQSIAILVSFGVGVWAGGAAERHFRKTDPGPVVIDEVLGMLVTFFPMRLGWAGALLGLLWFRLFDVIKPFPAGRLERWPAGLGIMADDLMAAIYANLALRLTLAAWNLVIG